MNHVVRPAVVVSGLIVASLVACTSPAPSSTGPVSDSPSTSAEVSAHVTPAATSWGAATFVTGTEELAQRTEGTLTTDPDGTVRSRGGTTVLRSEANDPRVSGDLRQTWDHLRWGTVNDGALVESGKATLTSAGGAWTGTFTGVYTSQTADVVTWWLVGSGRYTGLTFYRWVFGSNSRTWAGLIVPGAPPPTAVPLAPKALGAPFAPSAAASGPASAPTTSPGSPNVTSFGPATYLSGSYLIDTVDEGSVVTGPGVRSRSRGGGTVVTSRCDDPRVAGTKTETWNTDRWGGSGDGVLIQWGTGTLTNDQGSWVGSYSGAYSPANSDVITWWLVGTGAYEGLSFFRWIDGNTGVFHGLVFPGTPPSPA